MLPQTINPSLRNEGKYSDHCTNKVPVKQNWGHFGYFRGAEK
jgi:hypothetical protein